MTIVPCLSFHEALCRLPNDIQASANEFYLKAIRSPELSSLKIEKLNVPDPTFRSARVNIDVRIIISVQPGDTLYLLYIDHHQEAYRWAERKRWKGISAEGHLVLETIIDSEMSKKMQLQGGLFSAFSQSKLKQLRLDDQTLFAAQRIRDLQDLENNKSVFGNISYEILYFLAVGMPFEEVLEIAEDISDAKSSIAIEKQDVMVIDSEESLQEYIDVVNSGIGRWRYFLHPMQRKIVDASFNGPVYVTGEAGTGKTIVAIHRACKLAAQLPINSEEKVLLTTFTTNLATDLSGLVDGVCEKTVRSNIIIKNIDKLIAGLLHEIGETRQLIYGTELEDLWEAARKDGSAIARELSLQFYIDEWERVIVPWNISNEASYKSADRKGRGYPLSRAQRTAIWYVFQGFFDKMTSLGCIDVHSAARLISKHNNQFNRGRYKHIVVDEVQDFSQPMLSMLRAIAGPEHSNDMFMVGDENQNIYGKAMSFLNTGVDIADRKISLHVNYRTTEQIRAWAVSKLPGVVAASKALMFGQRPSVEVFACQQEENNHLIQTITGWLEHGCDPASVCIIAKIKSQITTIKHILNAAGIEAYEIKADQQLINTNFLNVATMYRVKGLEFDYVYIYGITSGVLPGKHTLAEPDKAKRFERERSERQLLYVAASRARKKLAISGAQPRSTYLAESVTF